MARIIPEAAQAFRSRIPAQQQFRRPRPPKRTGLQDAADIMRIIQAGVGTAGDVFNLGQSVVEAFKDTEAEKIAELQREAIEGQSRAIEVGRPAHRVDPRSLVAQQRLADTQRVLAEKAGPTPFGFDVGSLAMGTTPVGERVPMSDLVEGPGAGPDAPLTEQAVRSAVAEARALPERFGLVGEPLVEQAMQRAVQPPADTPENRATLTAAVAKLRETGNEDKLPQLEAAIRQGGQAKVDQLKALLLEHGAFAGLAPIQKAGVAVLDAELQREGRSRELARPESVSATQFVERVGAGDSFSISDLAASYGALTAQGKNPEARELLRLAQGADDFASFITNSEEPMSLVVARAREAIKQGALPREGETGVTFEHVKGLAGLVSKQRAKRRRRPSPGGGGGKGGDIWKRAMRSVDVHHKGKVSKTDRETFEADVFADRYGPAADVVAKIKKKTGLDLSAKRPVVRQADVEKAEAAKLKVATDAAEEEARAAATKAKDDKAALDKARTAASKALGVAGVTMPDDGQRAATLTELLARLDYARRQQSFFQKRLTGIKGERGRANRQRANIKPKVKTAREDVRKLAAAYNALKAYKPAVAIETPAAPQGL